MGEREVINPILSLAYKRLNLNQNSETENVLQKLIPVKGGHSRLWAVVFSKFDSN